MSRFADLDYRNITAGIASGLLAITGPPTLILEAAGNGNFTTTQTILWMFSCIILLFGIFSWKLVPLIQALPKAFVSMLFGFALLGVFGNSLSVGFSKQTMKLSAAFAFLIAVSDFMILNISAPVWALVVGTFIARYVEGSR